MKLATANKYERGIIKYPTGKFGFVGSAIPVSLALDENGHTRVFETREDALRAAHNVHCNICAGTAEYCATQENQ